MGNTASATTPTLVVEDPKQWKRIVSCIHDESHLGMKHTNKTAAKTLRSISERSYLKVQKRKDDAAMEQVIAILLGKGNNEYTTFCKMLRQSNYELWANELKSTAERFQEDKGTAVAFHTQQCQAIGHLQTGYTAERFPCQSEGVQE